jgi:exopolysaccharide biosynthesis WecB/TagA/CpsF family protein
MATSHRTTDFSEDRRPPAGYSALRGRSRGPSWFAGGPRPMPHREDRADPLETIRLGAAPLTRRIGHVDVCVATLDSALQRIGQAVETRKAGMWGFCNAHTVNMARSLPHFRAILSQMTLFNDGVGLDLASRILYGSRFPDNLNGTDFTPALLRRLPAGTPVFLLGSAPGVADRAADRIKADYPNIAIAGVQHGFFALAEEEAVLTRIAASGARLVLVAMGHPRQESWSAWACHQLDMPLLCVGAFLDFTAGKVSRAPAIVRNLRLEWMYRLALEPRRLAKRYLLGNAQFVAAILLQRLRHGRARP